MTIRPTGSKSSYKRLAITISTPILCFAGWLYYINWQSPKYTKSNKHPVKVVEVTQVKQENFEKTIRLIGTIKPKHATALIAKGDGRLDVIVNPGQKVKKGTLIATIDNPDTEKNLELSIAASELAKTRFEKLNAVGNSGYISRKEIEEKKQEWLLAQKEVSRMKLDWQQLRLYAPFDGVVGSYIKRDGSVIKQNELVVQFFDPRELIVDFDFPCNRYPKVQPGQAVTIGEKNYSLTHLQAMIDPTTHMCPADLNIDCTDCILGDNIDLDVRIAHKPNAITIPYQALFLKNNQPYAYVVEKNKVILKSIEPGLRQKHRLEVVKGLKAGDTIVTRAQDRLYPGVEVQTTTQP
jgi:membrane fusion protein (multidrug efflux system)